MPALGGLDLHFDNTLGALLIGFSCSAMAFGILTVQVYTYYRRFPQDKAGYKILAAIIWVFSLVDQAFVGYTVYFFLVTNYLNPLALVGKPQWSLIMQMTFGAIVGFVIKACFTLRVWRFSYHNRWLTGFLFSVVTGQLGTTMAFTVKCFQLPSIPDVVKLKLMGSVALGLGVVADISIAGALCFYLQKIRSGQPGADSMVNTLVIYAVNTGILTSIVSLSTVILFNAMTNNFVFLCLYFILSKLYGISFLATLNTRKTIRGRGTDREGRTSSFQMVDSARRTGPMPVFKQEPIQIDRENDLRDQLRTHSSKFSTESSICAFKTDGSCGDLA